MFDKGNNIRISGGIFNNVVQTQITELTPFQRLEQAVASSAFHNSSDQYDPPKCHPGTRIAVLDRIMTWIRIPEDSVDDAPPRPIMWLNGKAGAGKSAIARSIAEECDTAGLLLASFFFSRSDTTRDNAEALIPTLAYQMSSLLPRSRPYLEESIARDPLIFKRSVEAQVLALIVEPMRELPYTPSRRLVIIDGLDECNDTNGQQKILDVIAQTVGEHHSPISFLVASRPEPTITDVFNSVKFSHIHIRLELNDSFNPDADIRLFFQESFNEIKQNHCLRTTIPHPWPTPRTLDALVKKASGKFIYASVVKNYVKSPRYPPASRLDVIMGLRASDHDHPFTELDALYMHIFKGLEDLETARKILTFLCLSAGVLDAIEPLSIFLDLELPKVEVCVGDLTSLLDITSDARQRRHISISHASLVDFLIDASRSGQFYIEAPMGHNMIAQQCLKIMNGNISMLRTGEGLAYSAAFFFHHCRSAAMTEDLRSHIIQFSMDQIFGQYDYEYVFSVYHLPIILDWVESQSWEGSQDLYVRLCREQHELLSKTSENYFTHPKTTLLLVASVEIWMQDFPRGEDYIDRSDILGSILELDNELHQIDQKNINIQTGTPWPVLNEGTAAFPVPRRTIRFFKDLFDRNIYSVSVTVLLKYLCDHRKYSGAGHLWEKFKLERRRNRPWKWHQMFKVGGLRETERRTDRVRKKMDRRQTRIKKDGNPHSSDPPLSTGIRKRHRTKRAYKLALQLLISFIHQAIEAPGDYDPQLIPLARRSTFSMLATHFPRLTRDAEVAIEELLAAVDDDQHEG